MEVTCPEGVGPGETVAFTTLDGTFEVEVPPGVAAGDVFVANVAPEAAAEAAPEAAAEAAADVAAEPEQPVVPAEGSAATRELVYALVEHAQHVLQGELQPFIEAKVHIFEQSLDELESGQGETLEQYAAFKEYESELEVVFDSFVAARGFASAAECFAAIDRAVVDDMARQKQDMEALQAQMQQMQQMFAAATMGAPADEGGQGGGIVISGASHEMPLLLFSQPIALTELLEQALTLGEYTTFSRVMRLKARQVALRRQYLSAAAERADARRERREQLSTPGAAEAAGVRELWSELNRRLDKHLESAMPAPLVALMRQEAENELEVLDECLAAGDSPPVDDKQSDGQRRKGEIVRAITGVRAGAWRLAVARLVVARLAVARLAVALLAIVARLAPPLSKRAARIPCRGSSGCARPACLAAGGWPPRSSRS